MHNWIAFKFNTHLKEHKAHLGTKFGFKYDQNWQSYKQFSIKNHTNCYVAMDSYRANHLTSR